MAEQKYVTEQEFRMYVKGVNGSLERIERQLVTLNDKLDRRLDDVDDKIETERKESLQSHRRLHKRIDDAEKNKGISKLTVLFITVVSSALVGVVVACITVALK